MCSHNVISVQVLTLSFLTTKGLPKAVVMLLQMILQMKITNEIANSKVDTHLPAPFNSKFKSLELEHIKTNKIIISLFRTHHEEKQNNVDDLFGSFI
jgi:hypothetical protein